MQESLGVFFLQLISFRFKYARSRRNILGGILVHPHTQNPGRRILLRGRALAVRFSDRALPAVRSAFWLYARGPNRPFLDSSLTPSVFH
jgi:hypothetical protein